MANNDQIFCPLCGTPMETSLKKPTDTRYKMKMHIICPKCGNDVKSALRKRHQHQDGNHD